MSRRVQINETGEDAICRRVGEQLHWKHGVELVDLSREQLMAMINEQLDDPSLPDKHRVLVMLGYGLGCTKLDNRELGQIMGRLKSEEPWSALYLNAEISRVIWRIAERIAAQLAGEEIPKRTAQFKFPPTEVNKYPEPEPAVLDHACIERVRQVLAPLNQRDREMMLLLWGLADGHLYSQRDVGRQYGLTGSRVQGIEKQVLKKYGERLRNIA